MFDLICEGFPVGSFVVSVGVSVASRGDFCGGDLEGGLILRISLPFWILWG